MNLFSVFGITYKSLLDLLRNWLWLGILEPVAAMAELVDALDSGSSRGNSVDVRVILAACVSFFSVRIVPDSGRVDAL